MRPLVLALAILPGAALAHGGTDFAHAHPHGAEGVWIAGAAFAAGALVSWLGGRIVRAVRKARF